ncbi:MAG: hypothetical protein IPP49_03005 [Saprospiraceae bacterium]|nr:hypothetical protein [Saprospiraceae bacterium]
MKRISKWVVPLEMEGKEGLLLFCAICGTHKLLLKYYGYKNYCIFAAVLIITHNIMTSNSGYGRKGAMFGKVVLTIILFIIMLIWIYNKNGHFVPVQ